MFGTPSRCKVLVFHSLLWKPYLENWIPKEQRKEGRTARLRRRAYRNNGPNDTWHCDGYDKLKPFGFPIHACIDGWSRKVLWLYVTRNSDACFSDFSNDLAVTEPSNDIVFLLWVCGLPKEVPVTLSYMHY